MVEGINFLNIKLELKDVFLGGDKSTQCDIRESNFLGLLRKWCTVLGKELNEIKINHGIYETCKINWNEKPKEMSKVEYAKEKLCPVCLLFGTTGWAKRFYLKMDIEEIKKIKQGIRIKKFIFYPVDTTINLRFIFDRYTLINFDKFEYSVNLLYYTLKYIEENEGKFTSKSIKLKGKLKVIEDNLLENLKSYKFSNINKKILKIIT